MWAQQAATEIIEPNSNYQPTYTQILSINDYQQAENSIHQNSTFQELPLEQLQLILDETDKIQSRREIVLIIAINFLQERCIKLTSYNNQLVNKIEDMEQELEWFRQIQDENVTHDFITMVQRQFQQYRQHFQNYRLKYASNLTTKNQQIATYKSKIQELEYQIEAIISKTTSYEQERESLITNNESLQTVNEKLNYQIQQLQQQLQYYQRQPNHSRKQGSQKNSFDNQVQAELESLIEKLMVQLQNQRIQKKKLTLNLKTMQNDIMSLEKELSNKKNQVYNLQINYLKYNRGQVKMGDFQGKRSTSKLNTNGHLQDDKKNRNQGKNTSRNGGNQTYLVDLINQGAQFSKKNRYIIAAKVVDFYLKNIQNSQIGTITLESLIVYGYSHAFAQNGMINLKKLTKAQQDGSLERSVWEMACVLDKLIIQIEGERSRSQVELTNLINSVLDQQSCQLDDALQIKKQLGKTLKILKI